jgi:hypothetical protein
MHVMESDVSNEPAKDYYLPVKLVRCNRQWNLGPERNGDVRLDYAR